MKFLKLFWEKFKKLSEFIGNVISAVCLFIFYYSVFLLFAVPFKLFSKDFNLKPFQSSWAVRNSYFSGLDDFKNE